jgi:CBS domain-containing protein
MAMLARDLMTRTPLTLPPDAPLATVASIFAERGISGAPVVAQDGRLLGIVTEGDLIRRLSASAEEPRGWLAGFLAPAGRQAADFARVHGRTAQDVMSRHIHGVAEDAPISEVARLIEQHRIRRVPVLRDGVLVGIVSRADLLRALMAPAGEAAADASDAQIRRALQKAMREQPWVDAFYIYPDVKDGVVSFYGYCRNEEVKRGLRVLAEGVPGVKGVQVMVEKQPLPVVTS